MIDSAAEIPVCPPNFGGPWCAVGMAMRPARIVSASGQVLRHFGRKRVTMQIEDQIVTMDFEVVGVKRPILSVVRLRDCG